MRPSSNNSLLNIQPNCKMAYVEIDPSARYGRFKEILGKGAMKTVYRAFDEVLGMEVAWSQIMLNTVLRSPNELKRLYSEVHLLKNLNHDSIIRFYNAWIDIDNRTLNFITEMFTSGTLREYRKKYEQVDVRAIKNWGRQILSGLVYLHSRDPPVIHRDLKCDNIFVNGHLGQVKIGDLGLAAILRGSQCAHSVIGTPEFMAPELYEEEYNQLVDVYSFGMCILEMLTFDYPYSECSNPAQIYKKVISGKKPEGFYRIQDVEAQKFVAKCLENASKRLSAHELMMDPFLAINEDLSLIPKTPLQIYSPKGVDVEMPFIVDYPVRNTDMTITGKLNLEDNTLYLKVQISDKDGQVRNVHFPFDIINDTVMDVATEMLKELDITDREPQEIAEMIEDEISSLASRWKDLNLLNFGNLEDNKGNGLSSHSNFEYSSGKEDGYNSSPEAGRHTVSNVRTRGTTNFGGPEENSSSKGPNKATGDALNTSKDKKSGSRKKLSKIRSFMDVRRQLLHRAVMQALNKPQSSKTIGSMENLGFMIP